METIFFLSAHWGNGPIFAAGSVLVKSGLGDQGVSFTSEYTPGSLDPG